MDGAVGTVTGRKGRVPTRGRTVLQHPDTDIWIMRWVFLSPFLIAFTMTYDRHELDRNIMQLRIGLAARPAKWLRARGSSLTSSSHILR